MTSRVPLRENEATGLDMLTVKYYAACERVQSGILRGKLLAWNVFLARGYRSLIADYALEHDDDDAMNIVLGAPHWLTFNTGTLEAIAGNSVNA